MELMNRREALKRTSLMLGGALSTSVIAGVLDGVAAEPATDWTPLALTSDQVHLVDDLVERLLPATDTPGAKEAKVVRFIDRMVAEYLRRTERETFFQGLELLDRKGFRRANASDQNGIIRALISEAKTEGREGNTSRFFLQLKEMTLLGFFTSEAGATRVLQYDPIPGRYQGCIPLAEVGGKAWAT